MANQVRVARCSAPPARRNEGGVAALYRGVWPTTVRAAILTASQLPVYDHTKHMLLSHPATAGHVKVRRSCGEPQALCILASKQPMPSQ